MGKDQNNCEIAPVEVTVTKTGSTTVVHAPYHSEYKGGHYHTVLGGDLTSTCGFAITNEKHGFRLSLRNKQGGEVVGTIDVHIGS